MYVGRAAGSLYSQKGGGANYQCITEEPANFDCGPGAGIDETAHMHGAEWGSVPSASLLFCTQDVPCVVCFVATHVAVLMTPGTYLCLQNWTREYHGWLMTQRNAYTNAS